MPRPFHRRFLLALIPAILVGSVSVVAGAATPAKVLKVGAAVADMTPSAFDPNSHTPSIDPPGMDGPRQWDFTEPYQDLDGNGYWSPGDPYADLNNNARYDGIWLGGGGGRDPKPPTKVADPVTARAFVVDNGRKRIAVEVLDVIGMFNSDMELIREKVAAQLPASALDEIFISSTHNESAPDVIGLWGPGLTPAGSGIGNSGVDDYWMRFAVDRAAQAIVDAYRARQPATLRFAETTQPANFLTCWSSYPYVRASKIPILQAVSTSTGQAIVTMMNYGIHAESLGFNPGAVEEQKYWISADWPYWATRALENRYGGVAIQMAGAVGSVETPKVFPTGTVSLTPTGQYDPGHPAGCRTIFATTGDPLPIGYYDETKAVGEGVAQRVIDALDTSAVPSSSDTIRFERETFFVPVSNLFFVGAGVGQVFPTRPFYQNGVEVPASSQLATDPGGTASRYDSPSPNTDGSFEVKTELVGYQIGDAQFISTPGEEFPIGYVRGFQGPQDMPYPDDPIADFVTAHMTGGFRFIEGLGEDMIGYLFPKANSVGIPGDRPDKDVTELTQGEFFSGTDRFGCGHSDDSEATSGDAGDIVAAHAVSILGRLGHSRDRILVGRYIWPDGSLHRNPLGDGTLGCDAETKGFAPAAGPAIGVMVVQNGKKTTFALPGVTISGAKQASAFIDYNGRRQGSGPTVDTRGVLLPDGSRIYVDVYPDV